MECLWPHLITLLATLALVLIPTNSEAYTLTLTRSGLVVKWPGKKPKLNLAANPVNRSGLTEAQIRDAVVKSLQRWKAASGGTLGFDYWQGTDLNDYKPTSEQNGLSSLYFTSNARGSSDISGNVIGLTQVWYDTDKGDIIETDVILNDLVYDFTVDPRDTTGFGSANSSGRVYIENVLTHELGHAFGLAHGGVMQSTMLYVESPEQAFLGCDDQIAISALYATPFSRSRGSIQGRVTLSGGGDGVAGAQVIAISRRRGTALGGALTDSSGTYRIGGLEPGSYYLVVEPYYAGSGALPAYYAGSTANHCGGSPFSRSFLLNGQGFPQETGAAAGSTSRAPDLIAHCAARGEAVPSMPATGTISGAPTVAHQTGVGGFGAVDRFSNQDAIYYHLSGIAGHIEVSALSYSLYSPIKAGLELLDQAGNTVASQSTSPIYQGTSGFANFDSRLVADVGAGDYVIRVTSTAVSKSEYPGGPIALDSTPFFLLAGSLNEPDPVSAATLPWNARCRMDENFPAYRSPKGKPQRNDDGGGFLGFCGRVKSKGSSGGPGNPTGGAPLGDILSWFLPWIVMLGCVRAIRGLSYFHAPFTFPWLVRGKFNRSVDPG